MNPIPINKDLILNIKASKDSIIPLMETTFESLDDFLLFHKWVTNKPQPKTNKPIDFNVSDSMIISVIAVNFE